MLRKLFILFAISLLFSTILVSADYYSLGAAGSGTENIAIAEHAICHGMINTSANVYFIPTRTLTEWQAFIDNPPPGVTILPCCAKVCP